MRFKFKNTIFEVKYSFLLIIAFSMLVCGYDYLLVLTFSILHEIGHIVTLLMFKGKPCNIVVSYCGIGMKHEEKLTPFKEFNFLVSGVLVNLIFTILDVHKEINLALLFVNSLPIYPLDGGRILKLMLNSIFKLELSDLIYKIISVVVVILTLFIAIITKSYSLVLIVFYVIIYSINNSIE